MAQNKLIGLDICLTSQKAANSQNNQKAPQSINPTQLTNKCSIKTENVRMDESLNVF